LPKAQDMKCRAAAGVLVVSLFVAAPSLATGTLYDDFSGGMISAKKWYGTGADVWMLETAREIVKGGVSGHRLHLGMTAYSAQQDDGLGVGGIFGLYFVSPQGITGASYDVEVKNAVARACPGKPSEEVVTGPEFRARFFNTQANPTSQKGDVEVAVGFDRRPTDIDSALTAAFIYQVCDNAACSSHTTLDQGTFGTVAPGTTNNIGVRWEQSRHRFVFELNGVTTVSKYDVADSSAPFAADKEIDVARVVADCAATPRPYTSIDAYFDNIRVIR
jgi:hypothetical protein